MGPPDNPRCDGVQPFPAKSGGGERRSSRLDSFGRQGSRAIQAVEGGLGRLSRGGILAGRLAEVGRVAFDIENVVDDLEG